MWLLTAGFITGADPCRTQRTDLMIDAQSTLNLWREHLSKLRNGSENATPVDGEPENPNADVRNLSDHDEVRRLTF